MNATKKGKTMTYTVAINSSGQATIPKAVRDLLGIVPGENRLTFDISNNQVILGKEKSRREQLLKSLDKIHKMLAEEEERNPKFASARKQYAGMTPEEVDEAYYATEEGRKELEEEYGIKF